MLQNPLLVPGGKILAATIFLQVCEMLHRKDSSYASMFLLSPSLLTLCSFWTRKTTLLARRLLSSQSRRSERRVRSASSSRFLALPTTRYISSAAIPSPYKDQSKHLLRQKSPPSCFRRRRHLGQPNSLDLGKDFIFLSRSQQQLGPFRLDHAPLGS